MPKTINIELSEGKYQALQKMAQQAHSSVSRVIEGVIENLLPEEGQASDDYKNDPLYKMEGSFNSGLGNLSINHDKYLYGN